MQNDSKTNVVPGQILTVLLGQSFADGTSLPTADGGRLVCRMSGPRDPADGPPEISASYLGAISSLPNRNENDGIAVFALTTALVDADGRLWQKTRPISTFEIWGAIMRQPVLYQMFDPPSKDPMYCNAESVTRRTLFEPVRTMIDCREHHLVEIVRDIENKTAPPTKPAIPYENAERLLFRFRLKYFGARIGLIEDRPAFRIRSTGQLTCDSRLVVTIQPTTNADMIVALDRHDRVLPPAEVELLDLGTLCSREARLGAGWEKPALDLPVLGDISVWQRELQEAGVEPSTWPAFKPNLSIRYEPRLAD